MGRGRAKAKQQKVARALKYSAHDTDLTALQRELAGGSDGQSARSSSTDDHDDDGEDYEDPDDDWRR
jgi:phage replication-related protein YjqB (UPF0714/DUF867 family)